MAFTASTAVSSLTSPAYSLYSTPSSNLPITRAGPNVFLWVPPSRFATRVCPPTCCKISKHLSPYPISATLQRQPTLQLPPSLQRTPTLNARLGRSPSSLTASAISDLSTTGQLERRLSLGGSSGAQLERKLSVTRNLKLERSASFVRSPPSAASPRRLTRLGSSLTGGFEQTVWGGSLKPPEGSINAPWHAVPAPKGHSEHQKKMGIVASAAAVGAAVHAGRAYTQRGGFGTLSDSHPPREYPGAWAPSIAPHPEMEDGGAGVYFDDTPLANAATEFDPLALGSSHLMAQLEIQNAKSGVAATAQNAYQGLLKQDWPVFLASLFAAPAALSAVFGALYMLDPSGLAIDDSVIQYAGPHLAESVSTGSANLFTFLNAFNMSLSMSTGVDPVAHAVSPFTMLVSQLNGMASQCMFVLLSGAVFARLSQPSQPVLCAEKALVCRLQEKRVLATRYVTKHELVDVRVEASLTRTVRSSTGDWCRTEQPIRLTQSRAAYQTGGMVIQHLVDRSSPLFGVTAQDLKDQDAVLRCTIVGLERETMSSVFHVEEYKAKEGKLAFAT